jgi:hypothetical protein
MTRDRDTFDMFNPRIRGRFAEDEDRDFDAKPTEVKKSKLIDLDMVLHAETHPGKSEQGAILVSDTGDENAAKWIPKSLCQFDDTGKTAKGTNKAGQHVTLKCVTVTTEEWVATDKGLI